MIETASSVESTWRIGRMGPGEGGRKGGREGGREGGRMS